MWSISGLQGATRTEWHKGCFENNAHAWAVFLPLEAAINWRPLCLHKLLADWMEAALLVLEIDPALEPMRAGNAWQSIYRGPSG